MSRSFRTRKRISMAAVAAVTAMVLAACGGTKDAGTSGEPASGSTPQSGAAAADLPTITPGKLTVGTGEPAFSPWVENDNPASGEGLEAAVAYAVAEKLGFKAEDVVWVRTPFETVIAPGPKSFDINLQQFSITEERQNAVDFSSPYYVTSQGILSAEGNKGADATSLKDLKDIKFGVAAGSNSGTIVEEKIAPTQQVAIFNSNDDAVAALRAGQIDALVTDLPTVLYLAAAVVDNGKVVGQFDSAAGGEEYAFLLAKDSPLTAPVTAAVDALRQDGTLDELANKWITEGAGAPVLK